MDEQSCGIEGEDNDPIKTRHFNNWVARILRNHVSPMEQDLAKLNTELTEHVGQDKIAQAKLQGGITVLVWLVPILAVAVPAVLLFVLYLMKQAGIFE